MAPGKPSSSSQAPQLIGSCTLVFALETGYRVRVPSRNLDSAQKLNNVPSIKSHMDDVELVEVPDLLAEGAFDEAVKDVDYIVHLASPLPEVSSPETFDVQKDLIEPARIGTIGILESAAKSLSVKRVVIASSIAVMEAKKGPDDLVPVPDPDKVDQNPFVGYTASKRIAHDAATKFMENERPHFDLVRILPSFVQGRNLLVTDKEKLGSGSNNILMDLVLSKKATVPRVASTVLVDDVAKTLILALDPKRAKGGENYIASASSSGKGAKWDDATEIVKKLFRKAVKSGVLPLRGLQESITVDYDVSKSETAFGLRYADLKT